jgi:hypothetical protein
MKTFNEFRCQDCDFRGKIYKLKHPEGGVAHFLCAGTPDTKELPEEFIDSFRCGIGYNGYLLKEALRPIDFPQVSYKD